jgi:SOS-response transcriptional repressor LexA
VRREQLRQQKLAKVNKILTLIANHVWEHGFQPSIRELAAMMGYTSPNYVQTLLTDHFKENAGGRSKLQTRGIEFDWRKYVTETSVPWDKRRKVRQYPSPGPHPKRRKAARKLGRLPEST